VPRKPPPAGDVRYTVGDLIKTRRLARGLTQRELANVMGVGFTTVEQWEQGYCQPDLSMFMRLARVHGMPLSKYLSLLDNVEPEPWESRDRDAARAHRPRKKNVAAADT